MIEAGRTELDHQAVFSPRFGALRVHKGGLEPDFQKKLRICAELHLPLAIDAEIL